MANQHLRILLALAGAAEAVTPGRLTRANRFNAA
jgi:hypothetical protein